MENNQNLPSEEIKVENNQTNNTTKPDTKLYNILSYIGILWLVGLLTPSIKDEKDVKFHVGQGILLTVVGIALNTILGVIQGITGIFVGLIDSFILSTLFSIFFTILYSASNIATLVLMIIGIVNANNGKEEPLPVIGKYAFYK